MSGQEERALSRPEAARSRRGAAVARCPSRPRRGRRQPLLWRRLPGATCSWEAAAGKGTAVSRRWHRVPSPNAPCPMPTGSLEQAAAAVAVPEEELLSVPGTARCYLPT